MAALRSWWLQYAALSLKSCKVLWHRKISLATFLLAPPVSVLLVYVLFTSIGHNRDVHNDAIEKLSSTLSPCDQHLASYSPPDSTLPLKRCITVGYVSDTGNSAQSVMKEVSRSVELGYGTDVWEFNSTESMLRFMWEKPGHVDFALGFSPGNFRSYELWTNTSSSYIPGAFSRLLTLQKAVNMAITKQVVLEEAKPPLELEFSMELGAFTDIGGSQSRRRMVQSANITRCQLVSLPRRNQDVVGVVGSTLVAGGVAISAIVLFMTLVSEKQKKLVGKLRQMGLQESAYISSWSSVFISLAFFSSLISVAVMKLVSNDLYVFEQTSFVVLFLALFVFFLGMVGLAFILSTLVTKPIWVTTLSSVILLGVLFSTLVLNFMSLGQNLDILDDSGKCLRQASSYDGIYAPHKPARFNEFLIFWFPWISYGRIFYRMYATTAYGTEHFSFGDIEARTTMAGHPSFSPPSLLSALMLMLGLWLVSIPLSWYIGQAFAGRANGKRPFSFPFQRGYWGFSTPLSPYHEGDLYAQEREKSRKEGSLRVVKLSKTYKSGTALREVSATMKSGEVFALLGHNGAGKSTMINILTGLTDATYGEVFFAGYSLKSDMSQIQALCGICPQFDALWDELNAEDHLHICAALQGLDKKQASESIKNSLETVDLVGEGNELVTTFSGGMKRRLSVCMAALGDQQRLIFLDEPTTGVDTINRKRIWQMVEKLKQDKVIVLTTHNMEEADSLGDKIAILHQGTLKAVGSSLFLKKEFGSGYQVSLLLASAEDAPEVEAIIKRVLPGAKIVQSSAGNIKVSLNHNSALGIPKLLAELKANLPGVEDNMPDSGRFLKEWGFSNTTLEEVFLRLSSQSNQQVNEESPPEAENLCLVCGTSKAEVVTLYTRTGMSVKVPNALCLSCALAPQADSASSTLVASNEESTGGLVRSPASASAAHRVDVREDESIDGKHIQETGQREAEEPPRSRFSLFRSQVWAVFYKNFKLNMAQKKLLIFLLVTYLVLVILMKFVTLSGNSSYASARCPGRSDLSGDICSFEDFLGGTQTTNVSWDVLAPETPTNVSSATSLSEILWEPVVPTVWFSTVGNVDLQLSAAGAQFKRVQINDFNEQFISGQQQLQKNSTTLGTSNCFFDHQLYVAPDLATANSTFDSLFPTSGVGINIEASSNDRKVQVSATARYKSMASKYLSEGIWLRATNLENSQCLSEAIRDLVILYKTPSPAPSDSLLRFLVLDSVSNAILDSVSENQTAGFITTTLKNYPSLMFVEHEGPHQVGFQNVMLVIMGISIFFPIFVRRILMERESGLLRMMRIAGMQPAAYWLGNYFYDYILTVIAASIFFVMGRIFGVIDASPFICAVVILVWAHALNALTVLTVSFFKSVRGASLFVVFAMVVSAVGSSFINLKYKAADRMPPAAAIFPPLGLARILFLIFSRTSGENQELTVDFIVLVLASTVIYCAAVFVNELRVFSSSFSVFKRRRSPSLTSEIKGDEDGKVEDMDIASEKAKVQGPASTRLAIKTEDLTKVFTTSSGKVKVAVNGLTLGLEHGEVFGLLGANGAGKTTALSMLSGSLAPTKGNIQIAGKQVTRKAQIPAGKLSICPQSDIFWEDLSVWSHFMFYAYLKGLNSGVARASVQTIAADLGLSGDSFQKPASSLSGGQLRRLSFGISLVGSPSILLMDEITTGLDPASRSTIWEVIKKQSNSGRLILLTTHSMEEADTLCTRIGIMAHGRLKCLGAPLYLKNRYGNGYVLTIVTEAEGNDSMDAFIRQVAPDATLMTAWQRQRKYSIKMFDLKHLFELLEDDMNKRQYGIREWQIEQTTLQDVFLRVSE